MTPATDVTAPLLMEAMQDRYPSCRYFAAMLLCGPISCFAETDYLAPAQTRDATLSSWSELRGPDALRPRKMLGHD